MATIARPIFLLTDFGVRDPYVGQVKAVIAGIAPECPIYDLSHDVESFAVDEGAWLLEVSLDVLPPGAVVMAVVDPGVGTGRRALVVQSGGRTLVGPDNGLLSALMPRPPLPPGPVHIRAPARTVVAGAGGLEVRELCEPSLMRGRVSNTFHARDVFGPAAAHIAAGADFRRAGPPVREALAFPAFQGYPAEMGVLEGYVVHVDRYGNLITTIRAPQLFPSFELEVAGRTVAGRVRTFADAPQGHVFCHADSSGHLAIAMNQGSAASELKVARGAPVRVRAR